MTASLSIPVLRLGRTYESLEKAEVVDHRTGQVLATVSQANAGLIRRDLKGLDRAAAALHALTCAELIDICAKAGELFMNEPLGLGAGGVVQSPAQYVETLSRTSGLPHVICRSNMEKIRTVLGGMDRILHGLTRGIDLGVIDRGIGEQTGVALSYTACAAAMGVVLPSNSPGVNSIWLPAVAMRMPVIIKPGREEPWTPMRIIQALTAAGFPADAFGFYPTDHEGSDAVLTGCGRAILFGDDLTVGQYANNTAVQVHGTGRSKIILGEDEADRWTDHLDLMTSSVADNGGRSCINASCIITPRHGDPIAAALAERLAGIEPRAADDPGATLAAFANPHFAQAISATIEEGLETPGAVDITAAHRTCARLAEHDGATFVLPTVVRCGSFDHPLANTEFMFPYVSVVEMDPHDAVDRIGPSLAVSAVTRDEPLTERLLRCPEIDRLNLGAVPTTRVQWDQPHEGNLFEFLYRRRAVLVGGQ